MSDFYATRWPGTPQPGYTAPPSAYVTALGNEALPLYGTDPGPRPYNPLNFGGGGEAGMMLQLGSQYLLPQLMGGKFPAQFNPEQHLYDQLLSRQHSESLQQAGAIASEQDKSQIEQLINGANRLATGRELNEAERLRNAGFAGHAVNFMPLLTARLGPDLVDQLHGSSGSSMLLSQYVQATGRGHIDPVTGQRGYTGQTSGMVSQEMFEQLFGPNANKAAMYGLSAGRAGVLMQELQNRGMLGPATGGMPWPDRIGKMGTEYRSVMADMARERDLGNVGNLPQLQTRLREMEGQLLDEGAVNRIAMRLPEIQQLKEAGTLTETTMEEARAKVRQSQRTLLSSPDQVKDLRDLENLPGGEDILRAGEADRYKSRIKNLSGVVKAMRDVFGDRGNPNAPIGQLMSELDKLTQGSLAVMSAGQVENMVRKSRAIARGTGVSLEAQEVLSASLTPLTDQLGLHRSFAATSAQGGIMIGQAVADTQRLDRPAWGSLTKNEAAALGAQLQATSAASPLMNALGAAVRMQETGLITADDTAQAPRNETQALIRAVRAGETTYDWDGRRRSIRQQPGAIKEMLQRDEGVNQATAYSIFTDTAGNQEYIQQQGLVEKVGLATQQEEIRQAMGSRLGGALRSQLNLDPQNLDRLRNAGVVQNQAELTHMTISIGQAVGQDLANMDPAARRDPGLRQTALAAAYKQRIQEQVRRRMPKADEATVTAVSDDLLTQLGGGRGMATLAETGWADFNRAMRETPFKSGEGALQMASPEVQRAKRRHEREQEAAMIMEKSLDPLATVGPIARLVDAMKAAEPGTKLTDILGTAFGGVELAEIKNREPDGPMAVALGLIEDTAKLDIHKPADFKIYQRNARVIRGILEGGEAATEALRELRAEQERDAPEPPQQLRQAELDVRTGKVLTDRSREAERTIQRQQRQATAAQDVVRLTEEGAAADQTPKQQEEKWRQAREVIATEVRRAGGLTLDGWKFTDGDRLQQTVDGQTKTQTLTTAEGLRLAGRLLTDRAAADTPQQSLPQILAERAARGSRLVRNVDEAWALAKKPEALDTQERVHQAVQVMERLAEDNSLRKALLPAAQNASISWAEWTPEERQQFTKEAQTVLQQQLLDPKTGGTREVGTAGGPRLTASGLIQADSVESRRQMAVVDTSIQAYATQHGDPQGELRGKYGDKDYRITGTHIITADGEESLGTAKGREMAMLRIQDHAAQQQKQVDQQQAAQTQRVVELHAAYGETPKPAYEEGDAEAQLAQRHKAYVEAADAVATAGKGWKPFAEKRVEGRAELFRGELAEYGRQRGLSGINSPDGLSRLDFERGEVLQRKSTEEEFYGTATRELEDGTTETVRVPRGEYASVRTREGQEQALQILAQNKPPAAPIESTGDLEKLIQTLSSQDPNDALSQILKVLQESLGVLKDEGSTTDAKGEAYQRVNATIQAEQQRAAAISALAQKPPEDKPPEQLAKHRQTLRDYIDSTGQISIQNADGDTLTAEGIRTKDGTRISLDDAVGQRRAAQIVQEHLASQVDATAAIEQDLATQEKTLASQNPTLREMRRLETDYSNPAMQSRHETISNRMAIATQNYLNARGGGREISSGPEALTKLTRDGLLTRESKDAPWKTQSLYGVTPAAAAARGEAMKLIEQDLIQKRRDGDKTRQELRSDITASQEMNAGDSLMTGLAQADKSTDQAAKDAGARVALTKYVKDIKARGGELRTADGEVVTAETLAAPVTTLTDKAERQLSGDGLRLKGEQSDAQITDETQLAAAIEILQAQEGKPTAKPELLEKLDLAAQNLEATGLSPASRALHLKQAQDALRTSLGSPTLINRAGAAATKRYQDQATAYAAKQVATGGGTWTTGDYEVTKDTISKRGKPGKDGKAAVVETVQRSSPEGQKLLQKLSQQDAATQTQGKHADNLTRAIAELEKARDKSGGVGYTLSDIVNTATRDGASNTAAAIKTLQDPKTDATAAAAAEKTIQQDGGRTVDAATKQAALILAGGKDGEISKDLEQLGQGGLRLLRTIQDKGQELQQLAGKATAQLGRPVTVSDLLAGLKLNAGEAGQEEADEFSKQARAAFSPLEQAYQKVTERRKDAANRKAGEAPDTPMSAFEIEAAKAERKFATDPRFAADKNAKLDVDGDGTSTTAEKQAHDVYGRWVRTVKDPRARAAMADPERKKAWLQKLSQDNGAAVFDRAIRGRGQAIQMAAKVTFDDTPFSKLDEAQRAKATAIADNWLQGKDLPAGLDAAQQTELERLQGEAKAIRGFQDVQVDGLDAAAKQAFDDAGLAGNQLGDSQDKKLAVTITGGNITLQEDGRLKVDLSGTSISNGATNKLGINVPTVA